MTVRVSKQPINLREKLSELERPIGLKGSDLMKSETVQEARDLISAGRKNMVINGNFDIWQRGNSSTNALANAFSSADRWEFHTRNLSTRNISRQSFTTGQTEVPGNPIYYLRFETSNDSGTPNGSYIMQKIEDVRVVSGEDVTVSFYAKANSGGGTFEVAFSQQFGFGGSGAVDIVAGYFIPTSSWKRYSFTVNLPSISGKTVGGASYLRLDIRFPVNTAVTLDVSQVQLESGKNATDFEHRSYGEELALCQRYYQIINASFSVGTIRNGTPYTGLMDYIVPFRDTPELETIDNVSGFTAYYGGNKTWTRESYVFYENNFYHRYDVTSLTNNDSFQVYGTYYLTAEL